MAHKDYGKFGSWKPSTLKIALVSLDCIFLGIAPVLVHLSKNAQGTYSFHPISVNFLTEVAKTVYAFAVLLAVGTGRSGAPMYRSVRSFIGDAYHNRLLAIPALLYAINNSLKFTMQLYFRPTTTKMLGNLKVFTIAVLMGSIMKRKFNVIQWEALFLLVAGITVNQMRGCSSGLNSDSPIPVIPAVLCTLGSITVPAAASVYNEYSMKKHMETSVHLQNFFLYFYGALFNLIPLLFQCVWQNQSLGQMFAHQSVVTLLLVVNNAAQGVLSSFFYKFADTILKKYSSTIATIFTALMSFFMFGHELTLNFLLGVSIVLISMHQFFTYGDKNKGTLEKQTLMYSPSMDQIALLNSRDDSFNESRQVLPR